MSWINLKEKELNLKLVRVKSCSKESYWYNDKIGKLYFVSVEKEPFIDKDRYIVYSYYDRAYDDNKDIVNSFFKSGSILDVDDCEIVLDTHCQNSKNLL